MAGYTVTSVVSSRQGRVYVAGAPRFNHTGKAILFTMHNNRSLTIHQALRGEQVAKGEAGRRVAEGAGQMGKAGLEGSLERISSLSVALSPDPQTSFLVGGHYFLHTSLGAGQSHPQRARPWSLLQQRQAGEFASLHFMDLMSLVHSPAFYP